jgi:hypothetical protein
MRSLLVKILGIGAAAATAGVVTWIALHRQTETDAGAETTAVRVAQAPTAQGQTPSPQQGTRAGNVATPAAVAAPFAFPATVSADVAALINQLQEFGASQAQADLVARGAGVVPELLAALVAIADRQDTLGSFDDELSRLERMKLQLYSVISQVASADAAPVLIDVARRSRPNSYAFIRASDALDLIGATAEGDRFATELAQRRGASPAMLGAAFARFSYRAPPPAVLQAAQEALSSSTDNGVRNLALRVVARGGQDAQVESAFRTLLANPSGIDFAALSAAAEVIRPPEFQKLIANAPIKPYYISAALEQNRYTWASTAEKTSDAQLMLSHGDRPEAQAVALKHLLETNQPDLLQRFGVARTVGDSPRLWVRPDAQVIIARLGYRLFSAGNGVAIARGVP